jgi:peptide deformylase
MKLPIFAYGQPVLKQVAEDIGKDYPSLEELIANMWETMYHASGVGLAAPQVGLPIRLFVVDTVQLVKDGEVDKGIKKVFINATLVEESGKPWAYEEGCLSIPDIRGDVSRQPEIVIEYFDEAFQLHEEKFTGLNARVIQHEYDHVDGILFVEHLAPLKRQLIKNKLQRIRRGEVDVDYAMVFAK